MTDRADPGTLEAARHGVPRSPEWPRVEAAHRARQPRCVACAEGANPGAGVQVHHIFPFHECVALGRPDLELDDRNLITLCEDEKGRPAENHHLLVGHLGSFQSSNLAVVKDATTTFHGMTAAQIRASEVWAREVAGRLKPLDAMSEADKAAFTAKMNAAFPKP